MKLNDIYEAQYSGHARGTLHWILDKFFEGPNDDGEYWVDESRFIVQYKGKEIIGLQITTDWRGKDHIIMIPNAGGVHLLSLHLSIGQVLPEIYMSIHQRD